MIASNSVIIAQFERFVAREAACIGAAPLERGVVPRAILRRGEARLSEWIREEIEPVLDGPLDIEFIARRLFLGPSGDLHVYWLCRPTSHVESWEARDRPDLVLMTSAGQAVTLSLEDDDEDLALIIHTEKPGFDVTPESDWPHNMGATARYAWTLSHSFIARLVQDITSQLDHGGFGWSFEHGNCDYLTKEIEHYIASTGEEEGYRSTTVIGGEVRRVGHCGWEATVTTLDGYTITASIKWEVTTGLMQLRICADAAL